MQKILNNWINIILADNQSSLVFLKQHVNQQFMINVANIFSFSAHIQPDGSLAEINEANKCDTKVFIPVSIGIHFIQNNHMDILKNITIEGDQKFAIGILEMLSSLEIVGVVYNRLPTSIANIFSVFIKTVKLIVNQLQLIFNNAGVSIGEYLQYETGVIVSKKELGDFYTKVDMVSDKFNHLIQRIRKN